MATQSEERAQSTPEGRTWLHTSWEWIKSIAIAVGIAFLIRWPVAEPFKIPSGSMIPTLGIGDRIFVNKHAYGVRWPFNGFRIPFTLTTIWYSDGWLWKGPLPDRWDIVVFKSVEHRAVHDTLVKRVVALPGERVLIHDGQIFINGEPLELPPGMPDVDYTSPRVYENDPNGPKGYALLPDDKFSLVPEDCVLLLGDNSGQSRDARWFGFVPHKHLLGEVTSIWWPYARWRDFTGYTDSLWWRGGWILVAIYAFVRLFVGRSVKVYSDGLAGAVNSGEHLAINFLGVPIPLTGLRVGDSRTLRRGDVVLYRPPRDANAPELLLGIVAGLPEEKVGIQDGRVQIDGKPIDNAGILSEARFTANDLGGKFGLAKGKEFTTVPDGHYFLLSNGAGGAPDSRSLGWIAHARVVGKATHVWWPLSAFRKLGLK